jgi:hypothetical protein
MLSVIESEMLSNLVTLLVQGDADDVAWQARKLQQLGLLRGQNLKTIQTSRVKLLAAVRKEIEREAMKRANMVDDATAGAGKSIASVLPANADPAIVAVIDTWEKAAAKKFDQAFAPMLSKADTIYTDTIYKAVAKQQLGMSGRQAIAEACSEWSQQGLQALTDSAGRQWTTEAYAQTVIRSNMTQAATATQFTRMEELGEDLVEISSHLGARPKCEPYQGKIYSMSGKSKNYPALSSTSYGDPAGLFGINCRHVPYPYFPGTEKTFSPQDEERNATAYASSQKQRALERSIREGKRNLDLMTKTKDEKQIERAKELLRNRERNMREFIDTTGRKRRTDREEIYL